jgi:hypothetical protein
VNPTPREPKWNSGVCHGKTTARLRNLPPGPLKLKIAGTAREIQLQQLARLLPGHFPPELPCVAAKAIRSIFPPSLQPHSCFCPSPLRRPP